MDLSDVIELVHFDRILPVVLIGTFAVGNGAWVLRLNGLRDGYSRKINHFCLSVLSAVFLFNLPDDSFIATAVVASGMVVMVYVWSALSSSQYVGAIIQSNVRDRDGSKGKLLVLLPLLTGQIATYGALALVNPLYAKVAFCAMGLGDGLAEPIGIRFGRRKYSIYDPIWRVWNTKSIEGSSVVLLVSCASCAVALWLGSDLGWMVLLAVSCSFAFLVTLVEAVSPRGLDNMLIISIGAAFLQFAVG